MLNPTFTPAPQTGVDAFADVVTAMKNDLSNAGIVNPVLADVAQITAVIDKVLNDVDDVPKILAGIRDILNTTDAILDLLDAVPFVDIVAEPLSAIVSVADDCLATANDVIGPIDRDIVKPCIPIFDDISKGLNEASNIVTTITQTVPDYLNTIGILSYMTDIADDLVDVLKGTAPGDNLAKLRDTYLSIRTDAVKALTPMADFLNQISDGISKIKSVLGASFDEIKNVSQEIMGKLDWVRGAFDPIVNAFQKITDAIAPIKWLLEVIGWLFKHIFEPILDAILEATGLKKLMDILGKKIKDALGISSIKDALDGKVSKDASAGWQSSTGTNAVSPGRSNWTKLTSALSNYSTRNPNGVRNDILALVNTILGTDIDPNKTGSIPDWSDPPTITGISNSQSVFAVAYSRVSRVNSITQKKELLARVGTPRALHPMFLLSNVLASSSAASPASNSALSTLQELAKTEVAALNEIQPASQALSENLALFDQAKQLPNQYSEEFNDFTNLLSDAKKVIDFLIGFDMMKDVLADIESPIEDQLSKLNALTHDIAAAVSAGQQVDQQVAQLLACFPDNTTVAKSIHFIDSVATGAQVLSAFNDQAQQLDAQLKGQFTDRINALMLQVNDAIDAATTQIKALSTNTQTAISKAAAINTFLTGYAGIFANVSKSVDVVSAEAMPKLSKGVSVLNTIASILDPLSAIIQQMNCTRGKDGALKADAAVAVETFKSAMKIGIQAKNAIITDAFSFVVGKIVPIDLIQANMASVKTYVDTNNPSSLIGEFSTALAEMSASMQPAYSYPVQGSDGKPRQVPNVLIDEDFKNKANELMKDMQAAAQAAGIAPGQ